MSERLMLCRVAIVTPHNPHRPQRRMSRLERRMSSLAVSTRERSYYRALTSLRMKAEEKQETFKKESEEEVQHLRHLRTEEWSDARSGAHIQFRDVGSLSGLDEHLVAAVRKKKEINVIAIDAKTSTVMGEELFKRQSDGMWKLDEKVQGSPFGAKLAEAVDGTLPFSLGVEGHDEVAFDLPYRRVYHLALGDRIGVRYDVCAHDGECDTDKHKLMPLFISASVSSLQDDFRYGLSIDNLDSIKDNTNCSFEPTDANFYFLDESGVYALPQEGQKIHVFHEGSWKDAEVVCRDSTLRNRYEVSMAHETLSGLKRVRVDLNSTNWCASEQNIAEHNKVRDSYLDKEYKLNEWVTDAMTGKKLRVEKQLVNIGMGNNGESTYDMDKLANVMLAQLHNKRGRTLGCLKINGGLGVEDGCLLSTLIKAKAGTGKTWTTKQLMAKLCSPEARKSSDGQYGAVLLVAVQHLASAMRGGVPDKKSLLRWYIKEKYAEQQDIKTMLLAMYDSRRLIIIIDGIDEASDLKTEIEDYLLKDLIAEGHILCVTSRPEGISSEGVPDALYKLTFTILALKELTSEQLTKMLKDQMKEEHEGKEFFENLFRFSQARSEMDKLCDELCPKELVARSVTAFDHTKGAWTDKNGTNYVDCRQLNFESEVAKDIDELYEVATDALKQYKDILKTKMRDAFDR